MKDRHDPKSKLNQWKSKHVKCQRSQKCSKPCRCGFKWQSPLLGSRVQVAPGERAAVLMDLSVRIHPNSCCIFPLKVAATLLRGSRKDEVGAQ